MWKIGLIVSIVGEAIDEKIQTIQRNIGQEVVCKPTFTRSELDQRRQPTSYEDENIERGRQQYRQSRSIQVNQQENMRDNKAEYSKQNQSQKYGTQQRRSINVLR